MRKRLRIQVMSGKIMGKCGYGKQRITSGDEAEQSVKEA